jgi:hypothetical protein
MDNDKVVYEDIERTKREIAARKEAAADNAAALDHLVRAAAFLGVSAGLYFGCETLATADKDGMDTLILLTHSVGAIYLILLSVVFLVLGVFCLARFFAFDLITGVDGTVLTEEQRGRRSIIYSAVLIAPLVWITVFAVGWPWG